MTRPTEVDKQITDSDETVNVKVLADAPATALGNLLIASSQALSNTLHNATSSQQQLTITSQAALTMCVSAILGEENQSPLLPTNANNSEA